ncbi:MAG: hypothetical protein WD651_01360 [Acidimicrobiia bacterium]
MRAQGRFHVFRELNFNRGLFFWVGTRELLPSGWRWFSAVVQHDAEQNENSLTYLAQSALQRVARALQARDAIHVALNQPQNNDTRDQALSSLDVVLMLLMGAVDAAARVAHHVLNLDYPEHRAGWQREDWLSRVRKGARPHAAVVSEGAEATLVLTILRRLRNQIHGAALQGIGVMGSQEEQSLIALPPAAAEEVLEAAEALGGHEKWGLRSILPDRFHIDPGILVDQLFPAVLELLNSLMQQTPVERLPGVDSPPQEVPPIQGGAGGTLNPFDPIIRASIRWQLGF